MNDTRTKQRASSSSHGDDIIDNDEYEAEGRGGGAIVVNAIYVIYIPILQMIYNHEDGEKLLEW